MRALRRFTAIGFLCYPALIGPGMPSVKYLDRQLLYKLEFQEDLLEPSLDGCSILLSRYYAVTSGFMIKNVIINGVIMHTQNILLASFSPLCAVITTLSPKSKCTNNANTPRP